MRGFLAVEAVNEDLHHDPIRYRDGPIAPYASQFDLVSAQATGIEIATRRHIAANRDELFFTKLTDWETESEYRFMTVWNSPTDLFVDVSRALLAVVLGHLVPREYGPTFYALCEP